MALKIRLRRMGRRNAPTYRIVVAEALMPRDGRIVENLGHYNPRTEPITLKIDRARALHWIGHGATPTETARALLKRAGVFRPEEEQSVVERAVAAAESAAGAVAEKVKSTAKKTAAAVKDAAEEVRDAVEAAVGTAVEAVKGGDEEERPAVAAEAGDGAAAEPVAVAGEAPEASEAAAEPEAEAKA